MDKDAVISQLETSMMEAVKVSVVACEIILEELGTEGLMRFRARLHELEIPHGVGARVREALRAAEKSRL